MKGVVVLNSSSWKHQVALCLVSGGQDSTTSLFWARKYFGDVEAVSFDYGQRHKIELESAKKVCEMAKVALHTIIPINSFHFLGGTALTDDRVEIVVPSAGLPTTFVPGRNLIFLSLAAALAYQRSINHLVIGVCQTDYSGYPDCRDETVDAIQVALSLALDHRFYIHTPLMWLTKAETVKLAQDVGAWEALAYSHTCYRGQFPPCGECPACQIRARGFSEAGLADPLLSRLGKLGERHG